MNVADLLVGLNIKVTHFLARGVIERLLKVRSQTAPVAGSLVGDLVLLIQTLGAISGLGLVVKGSESRGESVGEAVLLV